MRSKFAVCLSVVVLLSILMTGCGTSVGGLSVPIEIENADHVRAISLNLLYDSTVLEVRAVDKGALAKGSNAGWQMEAPGQLKVIVQNAKYINGDGTLVTVKCKVLDTSGSSMLVVRVLGAISAETDEPIEAQVQVRDGTFTASDESVEAPVIDFGA